jgi:predicted DCC family thiol-disulfide oxidoreductase YuxK
MKNNSIIIIYDDSCPLCAAYTNAFIQTGIIEKEGRINFSNITPEMTERIDIKRSANEIPLIDTKTNQVWYGIDALLELLGQKIPFIKQAGNIQPIKWLLYKSYKLISFNRRVIVAAKKTTGGFDCTPDFNIRYRVFFMMICLAFNTWMLIPIQKYLLTAGPPQTTSILHLQYAHFVIVTLNVCIGLVLGQRKGLEYLGQVNMLALIAVLLTIPIITFNQYLQTANTTLNSFYLGILAVLIINEYFRRMKFANILPNYPMIVLLNLLTYAAMIWYLIF